jgi:hypothetical protein
MSQAEICALVGGLPKSEAECSPASLRD